MKKEWVIIIVIIMLLNNILALDRPTSVISNKNSFSVNGNLSLYLQTNNSGTWQNNRIVIDKKQIIIPANSNYSFINDWNSANVKPASSGNYRVFAKFESAGQIKNGVWEFLVNVIQNLYCNSVSDCNSKLTLNNVNVILSNDIAGNLQFVGNNSIFDCNGKKITGNENNNNGGIEIFSISSTIKNCIISKFKSSDGSPYTVGSGIFIRANAKNNILLNNTLFNNNVGVFIESNSGLDNLIINNTIYSNVVENVLYSETGEGIWCTMCNGNFKVIGNNIFNNSYNGIFLHNTGGILIQNNIIHDNLQNGIEIQSKGNNKMISNKIYNNSLYGIHISLPYHPDQGNNTLLNNQILNNSIGFYIEQGAVNSGTPSSLIQGNSFNDNLIFDVKCNDSLNGGVYIWQNNICKTKKDENCINSIDCGNQNQNIKNLSKYSNKEVFLVSDKDWRNVLPLVPVTTWTGSETGCQRGYGTPSDVCVYPTLIWHEGENLTKIPLSNNIIPGYQMVQINSNTYYQGYISNKNICSLVNNHLWLIDAGYLEKSANIGDLIHLNITLINCNVNPANISSIKIMPYCGEYSCTDYLSINQTNFINPIIIETNKTKSFIISIKFYKEFPKSRDYSSSIKFLQKYSANRVTISGQTPLELDNLLVAQPDLGAGIPSGNIQKINPENYLSYWKSFKDVVYVEDNYELALLASTYASLINAPLIIKGSSLDSSVIFSGRNIICVGNVAPAGASCSESYDLEGLQRKYIQLTNTDKIILVNPDDLKNYILDGFYDSQYMNTIWDTYGKTSLTSSLLASSKKEIIFSTNFYDYLNVTNFIKTKSALLNSPKHITVIASPNTIQMSYFYQGSVGEGSGHRSADSEYYSLQNLSSKIVNFSIGRIFGITSSDSSSLIARTLFYDKILKNPDKLGFFSSSSAICIGADVYGSSQVFRKMGYQTDYELGWNSTLQNLLMINKSLVIYSGHGNMKTIAGSGTMTSDLDDSFYIAEACLTCAFDMTGKKSSLYCSNALRKGAVAYLGAVDKSEKINYPDILSNIYSSRQPTIGEAVTDAKLAYNRGYYQRNQVLLGDPSLKIITPLTITKPELILINQNENNRTYTLKIPITKTFVPSGLVPGGDCQGNPNYYSYFSTMFGYPDFGANYNFDCFSDFNPINMSDKWRLNNYNIRNKCYMWTEGSVNVSGISTTGFTEYQQNLTFYS